MFTSFRYWKSRKSLNLAAIRKGINMKTLTSFAVVATLTASRVLARRQSTEVYGLHLHLDEKPYVDILTLERLPDGRIVGKMDVPNHVSGALRKLVIKGESISLDRLVPKR